jgi:hypothetical protein
LADVAVSAPKPGTERMEDEMDRGGVGDRRGIRRRIRVGLGRRIRIGLGRRIRAGLGRRSLIGGVGAVILLLLGIAGALASTLSDVLPRSASVYGQSYRDLMTRTWELYFTSPRLEPCQTVSINGRPVTLVENFHGGRSSCRVPAHQPIYINEYTTHCSTIPGDHAGFGTTANDLMTCSRGLGGATTKVLISVWLDRRNVPRFGNVFWRGTLAFPVQLTPKRFEGVAVRQIRAAAWGWSLLLRGLPKGNHTVLCRVLYPNRRYKTGSLITLHVS